MIEKIYMMLADCTLPETSEFGSITLIFLGLSFWIIMFGDNKQNRNLREFLKSFKNPKDK